MAVDTIEITGTITDISGNPKEGVEVLLSAAPTTTHGEAVDGVGVVWDPVSVLTDADGEFTVEAVPGFRVLLEISALKYAREFVVPESSTRFDLLGIYPLIDSTRAYTDADDVDQVRVVVLTDNPAVVLQRFDALDLEKAATREGPYTLEDRIDLESGKFSYEFVVPATSTDYFRVRYFDTAYGDESQYSDPKLAAAPESAAVLSIQELKDIYLLGVDLTDNDGNGYPDRLFQHYIDAAVAWMERELDIYITPRNVVNETHDHIGDDYGQWGYFQLDHYPTIRMDRVYFQYPSMTEAVDIDSDWWVLQEDGMHGVFQMVPGRGNIADVHLIPGELMPLWSGAHGRVPGVWHFDYRAGFEEGAIPEDVKHCVAILASYGVLDIAGDLVAGAGIANFSISVPGLSQSVGTTSSATNSGYASRIIQYQKELEYLLPALKRYYGKALRMVVA